MSTKRISARPARDHTHELPSREAILEALASESIPVDEQHLAKRLGVIDAAREGLRRRLAAMARDGQLLRNRRGAILIAGKLDLVSGRINGFSDGRGLVAGDDGVDYMLSPREMQQVMHGDKVLARPSGVDRRGRHEAVIVEVLERVNSRLVGRFHRERGVALVVPSDRRIGLDVLIEPDGDGGARGGEIVTVEIVAAPSRHAQPIGRVIEVLGHATDPGMEIEIALRKHQLPFEFSRAAERRLERLPEGVRPSDRSGREDLTHLPFVTIDGETARDFDDAVCCEQDGRGFTLFVAIADVANYVRHGDPIDRDARERGTSVYFPRRVIPMLPEKLSNGLCSLNPDVERLAMVCEMTITRTGRIKQSRFFAGLIRSRARLTYTQVARALYGLQVESAEVPESLIEPLRVLDTVFRKLLTARSRRGAIEFETTETQLEFDSTGKIASIAALTRNDAHRLIEECMLAANVCAAELLEGSGHPFLYRVHDGPTLEKLENLRAFLASFGLTLPGKDKPHAKDYARVLETIAGRADAQLLQTVILRSMQQAVYSPHNLGHFGLAYPAYTHFTSPIRRYPDLLVHRAIKAVSEGRWYEPGDWHELGVHCSRTERRADEASRDVLQWLKCYYMRDRINEEFDGVVSAVTGFGVFATLDGIFVEGLIHISELGSDYFHFDPAKHELRGERTGRVYRLADRIRARLVRVDLDLARIDLVPVE